jgi:hypothetical protein
VDFLEAMNNKRRILTIAAMIAFLAIIAAHYTGWFPRQVKPGTWFKKTEWHRATAKEFLNGADVAPGQLLPTTTWQEQLGSECYRTRLALVDMSRWNSIEENDRRSANYDTWHDDDDDVYDHMTAADPAFNDRLDYANECRERGERRDPGEIRMGA